mmetsp:Transcript_22949/g.52600  ORF Transcript_22949/g.52600 Transcript_22949/m.52600 type:complete len:573 (-) Transcript_22949:93-1811(-)
MGGDVGEQVALAGDLHVESDGLPMHERVCRDLFHDRMMRGHRQMKDALQRELVASHYMGVAGDAPTLQPLLTEKMGRSLESLSALAEAHGKDQARSKGYAEVSLGMIREEGVQCMCAMGDETTIAFAAAEGPLWIYNWREGAVVCTLRDAPSATAREGAVHSLCNASPDYSILATGDEQGLLNLWSIPEKAMKSEVKLHMDAIIGVSCSVDAGWMATASLDSYMVLFDLAKEQVVDRAMMWSSETCSGTRTSALCISEDPRNLIMVGAEDGHVHCFSKDAGRLREIGTLQCGASKPSKILCLPDGHGVVVGSTPLPSSASEATDGGHGGLHLFDLRKLGVYGENSLVTSYPSAPVEPDPGVVQHGRRLIPRTGVTDMALLQDGGALEAAAAAHSPPMTPQSSLIRTGGGDTAASRLRRKSHARGVVAHSQADADAPTICCLMDGVLRAFSIGRTGLRHHLDFDVTRGEGQAVPLNICAAGEEVLATTTTAPSIEFWRRKPAFEQYGHEDYQHPAPPPPLILAARCLPISHSHLPYSPATKLHAPSMLKPTAGATLDAIKASLAADSSRARAT